MNPRDRIREWLAQADQLEPFAPPAAVAFRRCAQELEADLHAAEDEVLTLEQAAEEAGLHRDTLRHLVADGTIPNAGRKGAPRIRRADLPRRARKSAPTAYDPAADALSLLGGRRRHA